MSKPKILIQFDPDNHASTFDSIVAIDAGVDQLLTQANVSPEELEPLVHGAMFTRGPADLKSTALFFGGSNVVKTETLVETAKKCFFGPVRVSLMSDPNGCNTTASAAVICAEKHLDLSQKTITILGGTGPVGQRIAQIVSTTIENGKPTTIRVCSRTLQKAELTCDRIKESLDAPESAQLVPTAVHDAASANEAVSGSSVVFACGAAGVELLADGWQTMSNAPAVAIDLNAVPPAGIHGIEVMDSANQRGNTICYGAIGVGGLKMKIHKRAIRKLFESNDQVLEIKEIYALGKTLE